MQSDEPHRNHASNGLTSPLEYPRSPGIYHEHRRGRPSADEFDEPDEFYRPFAERSSQPDIILQSVDGEMAVTGKRRHTNVNGTASKPSSSSSGTTRSSNRSVSGPTHNQTSGLSSAKSVPSLSTASRTRNGLIKERVKQFDQSRDQSPVEGASRYGRSRTPSASKTPSSTTQSPSQEFRVGKGRNVASPKGRANNSNRQPLFGEILDASAGAQDVGYGILREDDLDRSTHMPGAFPSRSRSQSDLDSSQPGSPSGSHQRSQSDASGAPTLSVDTSSPPSPTSDTASPTTRTLSPFSRIPVRTRRASEHVPPRHRPKTADSSRANNSATPPMTLSSRRYSPPKKIDPTQNLTAVIKPPLPKYSPPLRSTRTRQPVSFASTSASRLKVSDRYEKLSSSASANKSKPKPMIPGQVDVAERRARLQTKLQGGAGHAKPVRQDLNALQAKNSGARQRPKTGREEHGRDSDVSDSQSSTSVPQLSIETADETTQADMGAQNGDVDTEFEESPILSMEDRPPVIESPIDPGLPTSDLKPVFDDKIVPSDSLLRHVLSIRQASPLASPKTELPDDYLSNVDDGETIQILLGATPLLPQHNWKSPETEQSNSSPEAFHTPRETDIDDGSDVDVFDGRSSIHPDDSVSMVFQRKYVDLLASEPPPPPLPVNGPRFQTRQDFTLNSDARSEINHVLDQYQEGHVTPEMAHGFQIHVESMTPQLAGHHDAWESPEATKHYLRSLLDSESKEEHPSVLPTPVATTEPSHHEFEDEEEGETGGIAIIYGPTETFSRNSGDSFERSGSLHSHTASNATLRPAKDDDTSSQKSYLEDLVFRPAPPPKDFNDRTDASPERPSTRPRLPEITSSGSGLGLSIADNRSDSPPRSPHPPIPAHAPPPPPGPIRGNSMISIIEHELSASPTTYVRKIAMETFVPGLPESPAPRGRIREADNTYQSGGDSAKPSLEINTVSPRSQSPLGTGAGGMQASSPKVPVANRDQDKELTDRRNRIKELVDTEHSFHQDMTILTDIYMATSSSVLQDEDRRVLFGNVDQVRSFTMEFLDTLKKAASPVYTIPRENRWNYKRGSFGTSNSGTTENSSSTASLPFEERLSNDRCSTIGQVFCENLSRIEKVYGDWLKNHAAANKRLLELQQRPAVKYWLDECHDSAKDITAAWSLDSLIIKPAQRLLKYPLLLQDLLKYTAADHPDHAAIKQALEQVKAAAGRINDMKRRAELVEEAMSKRRDSDGKMKVGKLLNRRTEKLKQQVGLSGQAEDQDYDAVAQKFGGHFFQLQVVMRDVEKYLEDVQIYVDQFNRYMASMIQNIQTDGQTRWPEAESNWLKFATTLQEITDMALPDHVKQVRATVIEPVQQLWRLHVGPQKMMTKRKKRLAEFVRHKTLVEKGEKPDKKLEQEAELFKAVNDTLKEELPKLYALTKKLVDTCLLNFIELQGMWQNTWKRKLEPFVDGTEQLFAMDLSQTFTSVVAAYNQDILECEDAIDSYRICNGATLAEAQNFLSPTTTFTKDDDSSYKRPSTIGSSKRAMSLNSEQAALGTPNFSSRLSDNMGLSPLVGSFPMPDGLHQPMNGRTRASSAMSSRGPSTPQSLSAYPGPSVFIPARPTTSSERSSELSPPVPRLSLEAQSPRRLETDQNFLYADNGSVHGMPGSYTPDERFSGIFHSALPMSDSPRATSPDHEEGETKVLFLAASLFEFHIDRTRTEGGYPYLTYQPGEIFDVIAQKGELWLAKNQDDSSCALGWIWEKHFARILPEN